MKTLILLSALLGYNLQLETWNPPSNKMDVYNIPIAFCLEDYPKVAITPKAMQKEGTIEGKPAYFIAYDVNTDYALYYTDAVLKQDCPEWARPLIEPAREFIKEIEAQTKNGGEESHECEMGEQCDMDGCEMEKNQTW